MFRKTVSCHISHSRSSSFVWQARLSRLPPELASRPPPGCAPPPPPNLAQLLYLFQANNIKDKIKSIECYITVPPPHNITKNITCSKPIASRECRHRTQWMDQSQLKTAKCPFILDMDDIALDWDFYHACILPPRNLATT